MKKIKKEDIKQEVFDLYDGYAHNKFNRREFMNRLAIYAVGGLTVGSMLNFLMPNYLSAQQVPSNDTRLITTHIAYNSPKGGGNMHGLLAKPANTKGKIPGIIIIHENRGLNPYIEDVARRTALEGFLAFAPDALSPIGGYPGNDDEGRTMQKTRDSKEMLEDFISAYNFLKENPECSGKVGVVGFCFGGKMSNLMAVELPDLQAAVPFYGGQPTADQVPQINAPLLLHFAELDTRVNKGWPAYEEALKENNKEYTAHVYPGVNHGFHNDSTPRYDKDAATLAWSRTISFFKEKLI